MIFYKNNITESMKQISYETCKWFINFVSKPQYKLNIRKALPEDVELLFAELYAAYSHSINVPTYVDDYNEKIDINIYQYKHTVKSSAIVNEFSHNILNAIVGHLKYHMNKNGDEYIYDLFIKRIKTIINNRTDITVRQAISIVDLFISDYNEICAFIENLLNACYEIEYNKDIQYSTKESVLYNKAIKIFNKYNFEKLKIASCTYNHNIIFQFDIGVIDNIVKNSNYIYFSLSDIHDIIYVHDNMEIIHSPRGFIGIKIMHNYINAIIKKTICKFYEKSDLYKANIKLYNIIKTNSNFLSHVLINTKLVYDICKNPIYVSSDKHIAFDIDTIKNTANVFKLIDTELNVMKSLLNDFVPNKDIKIPEYFEDIKNSIKPKVYLNSIEHSNFEVFSTFIKLMNYTNYKENITYEDIHIIMALILNCQCNDNKWPPHNLISNLFLINKESIKNNSILKKYINTLTDEIYNYYVNYFDRFSNLNKEDYTNLLTNDVNNLSYCRNTIYDFVNGMDSMFNLMENKTVSNTKVDYLSTLLDLIKDLLKFYSYNINIDVANDSVSLFELYEKTFGHNSLEKRLYENTDENIGIIKINRQLRLEIKSENININEPIHCLINEAGKRLYNLINDDDIKADIDYTLQTVAFEIITSKTILYSYINSYIASIIEFVVKEFLKKDKWCNMHTYVYNLINLYIGPCNQFKHMYINRTHDNIRYYDIPMQITNRETKRILNYQDLISIRNILQLEVNKINDLLTLLEI